MTRHGPNFTLRDRGVNQEKALVGAFTVITNLRMELFEALVSSVAVVASSTIVSKNCLGLMPELNLTQEIKPQLSCSYFDDHDHCN